MTERLNALMNLNPEFAEALARGEKWAVDHADGVLALDGASSRRFPERSRDEDGRPKNHCGTCPHADGCMTCDLPGNHELKKMVGTLTDDPVFPPRRFKKVVPINSKKKR